MAKKPSVVEIACCPPSGAGGGRPALEDRPLLSFDEAGRVAALLKTLANDTRVRLLHHLARSREASVGDIAQALGMRPQAVSNQLQRLSDTGVVAARREGNRIFYRVKNGCVAPLLDLALCLMEDEGRRSEGGTDEAIH